MGLRKLEKGVSVISAPKPNNAGGTYSEQKLLDNIFRLMGGVPHGRPGSNRILS